LPDAPKGAGATGTSATPQAPALGQDGKSPISDTNPAPITASDKELGFADEAVTEGSRQLSPADEKALTALIQHGASADNIRRFVADRGMALANADEVVSARDKGQGVNDTIHYALPKVEPTDGATGASLRGFGDIPTIGLLDEAGAVVDTIGGTGGRPNVFNSDQSIDDLYHTNLDQNRGILAADAEQHPYARLAGQLAGGLVLPVGLEKAGLTASVESVGSAASKAALADGASEAEAARAAASAITKRTATEGAAYGAAYGAGSADGNASQRLEGAVTGGVEGGALGAGLGLASAKLAPIFEARRAASAGKAADFAEQQGGRQAIVRASQDQDIPILAAHVGDDALGRRTAAVAQTPYGANTIGAAARETADRFKARVGELAGDAHSPVDVGETFATRGQTAVNQGAAAADRTSRAVELALGQASDTTGAGHLIPRGISRFMDDTAQRADELHSAIDIAPDQPADLSATRNLLSDVTAQWKSNPELGAIFQNDKLAGYLDALTPKTEMVDRYSIGGGKRQPIEQQVGGTLSWTDLSQFRTRVGDMLSDPSLTEKIAPRQLRALYGALTTDMESTAKAAGADVFDNWKKFNRYYRGRMSRIDDLFSQVVGKNRDATPNQAMDSLQSMLRDGRTGNAAGFERVMRSLPSDDADTIRATIVSGQRGGEQFDPDAFAKSWDGLSERGKSALLPQAGMRSLMDDAASRAAANNVHPLAGMNGEKAYSALEKMTESKGDSKRFADMMTSASPEEVQAFRATYISRLGLADAGQQGAVGDTFSISKFLTRWNKMSREARLTLFGDQETMRSMNQLALLAARVKDVEKLAGHSNSGAILEFNKGGPGLALASAVAGGATGHGALGLSGAALVVLGAGSRAGYQRGTAELLTSPRFVQWLARAPKTPNPVAQRFYVDRLLTIARAEPSLADDILQVRQRLLGGAAQQGQIPVAATDNDNPGNQ
jgi:hypothetical protein